MELFVRALTVAALVVLASLLPPPSARADEIAVTIPTRSGVTETFAFASPAQPKAAAILFPGGEGSIGISSAFGAATIRRPGNFLIRSRDRFVALGIAAASLDAPSDSSGGISASFRASSEHAQDVAAVVAWLKQKTNLPVWLVGTSMGTISATNAAIHLGGAVDGVVLTSSVSAATKRLNGPNVLSLDLDRIAVPVLVMDHVNDACPASPPGNAKVIAGRLTRSPRVAVTLIEGGDTPRSVACEAFSYHGYLGVEDKAVAAIVAFMLAK